MRHPNSVYRALSHPPRGEIRRRTATPSHPTAAEPADRPTVGRSGPRRDSPSAGAPDAAHVVPAPMGVMTLVTAAVLTVLGVVALLTGSAAAQSLVLVGPLLALAGVLVQRPHVADRALAALLGTALLPALLLIALAVRLSGPGPVLVRRPHADGDRPYPALQFRTTRAAPGPEGGRTPVGRLLQSLSLVELPSLLDVVRADLPFRWRRLPPGGEPHDS